MSTGKPRDPSKERFWRRMVAQWQASGDSVHDFCDRQGLSEASFYAWRRLLRQRDAEEPHFVPVRVSNGSAAPPHADRASSGLELVLGDDRLLRIGPGFDAATLQRLLAVLAEGQP
jgi:transposase